MVESRPWRRLRVRLAVALTEFERARVRRTVGAFVEGRRPPHHLRQQADLAYRVSGQSVEIFEVREACGGAPGERIELPVAKATYVRTVRRWREVRAPFGAPDITGA